MATPTTLPATAVSGDVLTAAYVNDLRGAFRILQVVNASTATAATNSTSTYADTGLTATITPQSASSKILVMVDQGGCMKEVGNLNNALGLRLMRGVSEVSVFASQIGDNLTNSRNVVGNVTTQYLDSPATTSATTYKTQLRNSGIAAASVAVQYASINTSTITLMEISA
jgi:hypothetical protein